MGHQAVTSPFQQLYAPDDNSAALFGLDEVLEALQGDKPALVSRAVCVGQCGALRVLE